MTLASYIWTRGRTGNIFLRDGNRQNKGHSKHLIYFYFPSIPISSILLSSPSSSPLVHLIYFYFPSISISSIPTIIIVISRVHSFLLPTSLSSSSFEIDSPLYPESNWWLLIGVCALWSGRPVWDDHTSASPDWWTRLEGKAEKGRCDWRRRILLIRDWSTRPPTVGKVYARGDWWIWILVGDTTDGS